MRAFEEAKLGAMTLSGRIGVPAMCTYFVTTKDGVGNSHHVAHYEMLAKGQPAFVIQEATAVNVHGHISKECLGIYTPRQRIVLKEIVQAVHAYGVKIGIQLNHAGLKNQFGNQKYGPMTFDDVTMMDDTYIEETIINYEFAAKWARELGYDFIEVHAAHGYLVHQFLSPITNQRQDAYGKNRTLFLRRVIKACKDNFGNDVIVRISAEDYVESGLHVNMMNPVLHAIEEAGGSGVSVSSGGLNTKAIRTFPLYQIPMARQIKNMCTLPVLGGGLITKEEQVEDILRSEDCDFVLMGRKLLRDPFFLLKWKDRLHILKEDDIGTCLYRGIHRN